MSLIPHLGGGAGRVLVDTIRVLADRPHLVVCGVADDYVGMGLGAELDALGVPVRTVAAERDVRAVLEEVHPGVVIHHWWPNRLTGGPVRTGGERWIMYGHSACALPFGYDVYAVLSDFQLRFQSHLPAQRLHRIPNSVDRSRFRPRTSGRRRPVTIAMLSRFDPGKFPRRLLDHLPPLAELGARLLIAGRGGRRYEIEPEIRARGLQRVVRFVGVLASDRVPAFLAQADIGLHLTETAEECSPVAVIEMLASGLPVVSQPRGSLPEMVRAGVNGFLATDEGAIAGALARLIGSPSLRRRMGAASRRMSARHDLGRFRAAVRQLVDGAGEPRGTGRRARPPTLARGGGHGPSPRAPGRPGLAPWRPRMVYLVCGDSPSGLGLLCEALGRTGVAGVPEDYFSAPTVRRLGERAGIEGFVEYLAWVLEEGSTANGVFGAAILGSDLVGLARRLGVAPGAGPRDVAACLGAALPGLRYLWITRRHAADAAWQHFFTRSGAEAIPVSYGALRRDREGTVRGVLRRLEIEVPRELFLGERRRPAAPVGEA